MGEDRYYFKIALLCIRLLRFSYSNKSGMEEVLYYPRMTNISIIKSSSDLDNKKLFQVYGSSSKKVWSSSDSENEEEEKIDTDNPDSGNSDMLESLISLV